VVPAAASWVLRLAFPLAPYPCEVLRSIAGRAEGVVWRERARVLREGVAIVVAVCLRKCVVRKERERANERELMAFNIPRATNATACGHGTLH
jgi:hypothetical protein